MITCISCFSGVVTSYHISCLFSALFFTSWQLFSVMDWNRDISAIWLLWRAWYCPRRPQAGKSYRPNSNNKWSCRFKCIVYIVSVLAVGNLLCGVHLSIWCLCLSFTEGWQGCWTLSQLCQGECRVTFLSQRTEINKDAHSLLDIVTKKHMFGHLQLADLVGRQG